MSPIPGQSPKARAERIAKGCCPEHGETLQPGSWSGLMKCPRGDCNYYKPDPPKKKHRAKQPKLPPEVQSLIQELYECLSIASQYIGLAHPTPIISPDAARILQVMKRTRELLQ